MRSNVRQENYYRCPKQKLVLKLTGWIFRACWCPCKSWKLLKRKRKLRASVQDLQVRMGFIHSTNFHDSFLASCQKRRPFPIDIALIWRTLCFRVLSLLRITKDSVDSNFGIITCFSPPPPPISSFPAAIVKLRKNRDPSGSTEVSLICINEKDAWNI